MKRSLFYRLLIVNILFISTAVHSQNDTIYDYEEEMEQIIELSEEEDIKNYDNEMAELYERFEQPVNINTVNKEQLQELSFLSDIQIENILAYLYMHGEMKTIYELQLVKDMDWQTIRYMSAFFCANPVKKKDPFPSLREIFRNGKSELTSRLDIPFYRTAGYKNKYLGTPYYHSFRYAYRFKDKIWAGMTAEKDKGETFFAADNRKGYDAYSFYLLIKGSGLFKVIAVGDYRLSFGQGLVVSNNFLLGKSTYPFTLERRSNRIGKHSSTDEFNFFRGIATSVSLNRQLLLSAFFSYRRLDGTIKDRMLTSIHTSGLHRSEKELEDRNAFGLLFTGMNMNYSGDKIQGGITGVYYYFDRFYMPANRKYNKYAMRGSSFYNMSTDYSYRHHRFSFAGETAIGRRGIATLNRIRYSPLQGYDLLLFHRYYAHDYWAYFAHSFSENSSVQNENGWFLAADINPLRKISFFGAVDLVSFPWWRYRVSKPSCLTDILFRCTYFSTSEIKMDVNYRYKRKERDVTGSDGKDTRPTYQHALRYRLSYKSVSMFSLSSTIDWRLFKQQGFDSYTGFRITQAVTYAFRKLPFQIVCQGSYFHTDNYDTRVYVPERNLLYSFYIPSYQGTGLRLSLHLQCRIGSQWLLIAHGGRTRYYHQRMVGTGDEQIDGNTRTDLQLQMRWKI